MTDTSQHTMTDDQVTEMIKAVAAGYGTLLRSPLLKNPGNYGLEFEDINFSSSDGTRLEAWWIPCEGSQKLIIANHPLWFNRTYLARDRGLYGLVVCV